MTYFENYDVREWLEKCLSRHPRPSTRNRTKARPQQPPAKNLLLPIVSAGALFAAQHASLSIDTRGNRAASMAMQSDPERLSQLGEPFYWIGSVGVPSLIADFDERVTAICRQIQAGRIASVPARTLELATAVHQREPARKPSTEDGWITDLANLVAKLND